MHAFATKKGKKKGTLMNSNPLTDGKNISIVVNCNWSVNKEISTYFNILFNCSLFLSCDGDSFKYVFIFKILSHTKDRSNEPTVNEKITSTEAEGDTSFPNSKNKDFETKNT